MRGELQATLYAGSGRHRRVEREVVVNTSSAQKQLDQREDIGSKVGKRMT